MQVIAESSFASDKTGTLSLIIEGRVLPTAAMVLLIEKCANLSCVAASNRKELYNS